MQHRIHVALLVSMLIAVAARGQAPRTFVSSSGSDANPCSRQAPCRGFQAAISAVAPGGEVVALDSAGYGAFVVDRSVTVTADGVHAAITSLEQDAITMNTTASDAVVLRNLTILSTFGSGVSGVVVAGPIGKLTIDNCSFTGLQSAISFVPSTTSELHVRNTVVRSSTGGILVLPSFGVTALATVEDSFFDHTAAISVRSGTTGIVSRTQAYGSTFASAGVFDAENDATAVLTLIDCVAAGNAVGISASAGGIVRAAGTTIVNNGTGLLTSSGGTIVSLKGNRLTANTTDGSFDTSVATQ